MKNTYDALGKIHTYLKANGFSYKSVCDIHFRTGCSERTVRKALLLFKVMDMPVNKEGRQYLKDKAGRFISMP